MLRDFKSLGRETMVYGLSTVAARMLNILLLPLHTHYLQPAELGLVAALFSYIVFLNVVYGFGMDSAFMRHFKPEDPARAKPVFSTAFWSLAASALTFSSLIHLLAEPIAAAIGIPAHLAVNVRYAAWILAFDALSLVPFACLRMEHRSGLYAGIRSVNIVINLVLSAYFLAGLRQGIEGVFTAGLVASAASLAGLAPVIASNLSWSFDRSLAKELLRFGLPLLPAGLASMAVQVIDRPILKSLAGDAAVGLYQANYRIAIFMQMAVNMFDAAWRPFFLERAGRPDAPRVLGRTLTYFAAGAAFLLLFISLFAGPAAAWRLWGGAPLIPPVYWAGLAIVPVVALGYLCNGIYVNLLAPVIIAKKSELVLYATMLGAAVNIAANLLWIPRWGMMGAAYATLAAYAAMAAALYWLGRGLYRVEYEGGRLLRVALAATGVALAARGLGLAMAPGEPGRLALRASLLLAFPLGLAAMGFLKPGERDAMKRLLQRKNA